MLKFSAFRLFITAKFQDLKKNIFFIQKALARPRQPFCHSSLDVFSLAANAKNSVAESRVVRNDKRKQNVARDVTRKPKLKIDDGGQ